MLYFKQVYYTVSTDDKSFAHNYFSDDVDVNQLSKKTGKGNPLCVVSEIDYGKIIMVKITSTKTFDEINKDVSAGFTKIGFKDGKGSYGTNDCFNESEYSFEAKVYGGSAEDGAKIVTSSNIKEILEIIRNGANYSIDNPGFPIGYKVRHLSDGSFAEVGCATEYIEQQWSQALSSFKLELGGYTFEKGGAESEIEFYYTIELVDENGTVLGSASKGVNEYVAVNQNVSYNINRTFNNIIQTRENQKFKLRIKMWDSDIFEEEVVVNETRDITSVFEEADQSQNGTVNFTLTNLHDKLAGYTFTSSLKIKVTRL